MSALTPPEHENNEIVVQAAIYLVDEKDPPQPIIPYIRERFGLTAVEACEACAMAQRFRTYRVAHA
ncbi:hypothetical protein [Rhizobium mongolense]|uniref:Uncharacterized protein n=1 Tax=Rhizobium mongolense TaxID=57676 RepID=A0A7W6RI26_9HYPH|nr:hypothetical protein [Rhizobium mongolense]MBB4272328.1 hypothetical protein [Rhizobium mongolense]